MFPKVIDLTDFSASECSNIVLMLKLCYMFWAKCEEPRISSNVAQMLRVFFEELRLW